MFMSKNKYFDLFMFVFDWLIFGLAVGYVIYTPFREWVNSGNHLAIYLSATFIFVLLSIYRFCVNFSSTLKKVVEEDEADKASL